MTAEGIAMPTATKVLLISGSTRSGSTNTAVLRTAQVMARDGVRATVYEGLAELPAFNPDHDQEPLPPAVADLRHRIASADALVFCTPEYAGALPGSFKNLLDWTVGGGEIYRKPVTWINVAAEGRGANAQLSLETVLCYVGADVVQDASRRLPITAAAIGPDGLVADAVVREGVAAVLTELGRHVALSSSSPQAE